MKQTTNSTVESRSTLMGIAAIMFWSTTIAFSRSLTEQLGTLTAASMIYSCAGIIGIALAGFRPGWYGMLRKLPIKYLASCGGLFVTYMVTLYLAIGMASSRTQVLAVGLINYLWPGLSLIFSIPILGKKGAPILLFGISVALLGVWVASTSANEVSLADFLQDRDVWVSYGLALTAAICWGLYSTLSRRWAAEYDGSGVQLFLLASGLVLGIMRVFFTETASWTVRTGFELAYMAIFPGMLGYLLWDQAVRKGDITLISAISYLTPLLSTLISVIVLDILPANGIWIGAALVIGGAILCKKGIKD